MANGLRSSRFAWKNGGYILDEGGENQWDGWANAERSIKGWSERDYILLKCVDSKRSEIYNTKRSKPFVRGHKSYVDPGIVDFAYKTFSCVHSGRRRRRDSQTAAEESQASSTSRTRTTRTLQIGCPFRIHAAYKPHLKKIVITDIYEHEEVAGSSFAVGHNHKATKEMFDLYPHNLKMSDVEIRRQEELLSLGVTASQAARLLREETGKPFTSKHVHNERARIKERARGGRTDLEEVREILLEFKGRYPSLRYEICTREGMLDDEDLQRRRKTRKEVEEKFLNMEVINILLPGGMEFGRLYGEVILLDGTYNTNSLSYPLTLLSVEDAFGATRIVQMSIVVSENEETLGRSLEFYKHHVGGALPKTVMIDKDCKEQSAIRNVFPTARILFCRWHVIKYIYQMISEKVRGSSELKRSLRQTAKDMAYARTEEEYDTLYNEMLTMLGEQHADYPDAFGPYFERNWHSPEKRRQWTQYLRRGCVTFQNDTNNRAEAMNGVVKRRTKREFTLRELISTLLEIADEGVFNFKNLAVKATMYVPMETRQPTSFFLSQVTNVASSFLCEEAARMSRQHVEPLIDMASTAGTARNAISDISFQVWKWDGNSEGSVAVPHSDESIHRVTMSLDDFAMIKDVLSLSQELPKLDQELSSREERENGENGERAKGDGGVCDNREMQSRAGTNAYDEAGVDCGRESESAEGLVRNIGAEELDAHGDEEGESGASERERERETYKVCSAVDTESGEGVMVECDCARYFMYGGLPCRHVLAVLEHEFGTCAILLTIPRRWWVRSAARLAQEIHSSISGNDADDPCTDGDIINLPSSRNELSVRVAGLPALKRLPVFKRICLDLAYLCADSKRVSSELASNIMGTVERLTEEARAAALSGSEEIRYLKELEHGDPESAECGTLPVVAEISEGEEGEADSPPSPEANTEKDVPQIPDELGEQQESIVLTPPGKQPGRPKMSERKRRAQMNVADLAAAMVVKRRKYERDGDLEKARRHMGIDEAHMFFGRSSFSDIQSYVTENPNREFPLIIPGKRCRLRRFASQGDSSVSVLLRNLGIKPDREIGFSLANASSLCQQGVQKLIGVRRGNSKRKDEPIVIKKEEEDSFGMVAEILEHPFSNSYFLTLRQLRIMSGTTKAVAVWTESKLLFLWISKMEDDFSYEEGSSSCPRRLSDSIAREVDVDHAVALIRSVLSCMPLCSLERANRTIQKDGVVYNLETLCSIRGSVSKHTPNLLHSDLIEAYLQRISDSLSPTLRKCTFLMPMFEWAPCRYAQNYSVEVFLDRLSAQKHRILSASKSELSNALVFAVCNVNDSHWIALEVDLAASVTLIYDPAVGVGKLVRKTQADRLLRVLSAVLKQKNINRALQIEMRVSQSPGGQQDLATDSFNCGVYSLMWVRFRVRQAANQAEDEKRRAGKEIKRSRRKVLGTNSRMPDRTLREMELARLSILYDLCRYIDWLRHI